MQCLNQDEYDHYWNKGWLVRNGIFDPKSADRIAAQAVALAENELDGSDHLMADHGADGMVHPRTIKRPYSKGGPFMGRHGRETEKHVKRLTRVAFIAGNSSREW